MRHLFISDLHLGDHNPQLEQMFLAFMDHLPQAEDRLYILGDLFEIWLGDDAQLNQAKTVIEALKHFTQKGGKGYLMHGNRDFLMGNDFCTATGMELIDEPYPLKLGNQSCCLLHGDSLCTDDTDYQAFKRIVRQAAWQSDFLSKSVPERLEIAKQLREKSQQSMQNKSEEIMDVALEAVQELFTSSQADIIIHGHTHRQNRHRYEINNQCKERIVLGDWGATASVLSYHDNSFELKNYSLSELQSL